MLKKRAVRSLLLPLVLLPQFLLAACSPGSDGGPGGTSGRGAGGSAGRGGSSGSAGAGGTVVSTGGQGGGPSAAGGTGGQAAPTNTGGTGGTSPAGTGGATGADASPEVSADTRPVGDGAGMSTDPGTMGNGRFAGPPPPIPPEAAARMPGVMAGTMRNIQIPAGILPARSGQVYTPAGYVPGTPVAFMVFHDGGAYVANFKIPIIFDNLIAQKKIPMMVGIFIPPSGMRSPEYDTVSDRYGRYVVTDVFPEVEKLGIKLTTDPEASGVGGHSSGGICAFSMAWFHPDRFRRVLSNSGSFLMLQNPGGDMYDSLIRTTMPRKPIRTAMTVGTADLGGMRWFNASETMYKALSESSYNVRYIVINGGSHDQSSPMPTTPDLIEWLWRGYPISGPTR